MDKTPTYEKKNNGNCEEKSHKPTLMQIEFSLPKKIIFSAVIMAVLIIFVYFFGVPNPNMILIAGLVLCSAVFGYGGGITSAVIMLFYTLFFFSTDHSFIHFTEQNIQKVFVSFVGIFVDLMLVCSLKCEEIKAFKNVRFLTEELKQENETLQMISKQDTLTGIQNRMALRHNYSSYEKCEITVMMLDLDNFKAINDTYGHEEGDRILRETGKLLADTFGKKNCYRYGGDEFVILCPDLSETEFKEKLSAMMKSTPEISKDKDGAKADFSFGYIHSEINELNDLKELLSAADKLMYDAKKAKKIK